MDSPSFYHALEGIINHNSGNDDESDPNIGIENDRTVAAMNDSTHVNESFLEQLMNMGFPYNGSMRALLNTNNSSAEAALDWVFAHMEDQNFDDSVDDLLQSKKGRALLYIDVFVASNILEYWTTTGKNTPTKYSLSLSLSLSYITLIAIATNLTQPPLPCFSNYILFSFSP